MSENIQVTEENGRRVFSIDVSGLSLGAAEDYLNLIKGQFEKRAPQDIVTQEVVPQITTVLGTHPPVPDEAAVEAMKDSLQIVDEMVDETARETSVIEDFLLSQARRVFDEKALLVPTSRPNYVSLTCTDGLSFRLAVGNANLATGEFGALVSHAEVLGTYQMTTKTLLSLYDQIANLNLTRK